VNVLAVVLGTTRWTVVVPPAVAWSVARTALVEVRSMPGLTTTLLVPAATVAMPALLSSRTLPVVRRA
jgi:hypothetical protein